MFEFIYCLKYVEKYERFIASKGGKEVSIYAYIEAELINVWDTFPQSETSRFAQAEILTHVPVEIGSKI